MPGRRRVLHPTGSWFTEWGAKGNAAQFRLPREMSLTKSIFKSARKGLHLGATLAALAVAGVTVSGCTTQEVLNQGYIVDPTALALTPVGSSREQVLLSLGTPSTTATFDNEVFYYISQKRVRNAMFLKPRLVEQEILAVYFDDEDTVGKIAHYTLQDGQAFDMISRTTPTGGKDQTFLVQMLTGASGSKATANAIGRSLGGGRGRNY